MISNEKWEKNEMNREGHKEAKECNAIKKELTANKNSPIIWKAKMDKMMSI